VRDPICMRVAPWFCFRTSARRGINPEAVEKIAVAGKLNVVMGDKGLVDKIVNLI